MRENGRRRERERERERGGKGSPIWENIEAQWPPTSALTRESAGSETIMIVLHSLGGSIDQKNSVTGVGGSSDSKNLGGRQ